MTIDLKHSIILQNQIKRAVNSLCKEVISDIDKNQELNIVKRCFEIETSNHKKYQIIFQIRER